ncbi:tRNA pseudouridine(55) synthase TruB [bacterium]|nr:tRNA pseudouridine(55) synthase TruB [bacterium]
MLNGFININKDLGITSNDVVFKVKRILFPIFGKVKIGHTGTLDPLATGVLPIALGEATKTIQFQMDGKKTYIFNITFGSSTTTDDKEGEIIDTSSHIPTKEEIEKILPSFSGAIEQTPPKYSAIKINGKRAYTLARDGKDFEIQPRPNFIHDLKLLSQISDTEFQFTVTANKGFYVRSIGRDIATALGSCGHISYLHRTQNGKFTINDSISLDKLEKIMQNTNKSLDVRNCIGDFLYPVSYGLNDILVLDISKEQNEKLRNGIALSSSLFNNLRDNTLYQVHYNQTLQAIVKNINNKLKIIRIFNL